MINQELLQYLCCPRCKSALTEQDIFLVCEKCGQKYEIIDENIVKIIPNLTQDLELSIQKWDEFYQKQLRDKSCFKEREDYLDNFFEDEYRQINEYKKINNDLVFLEVGCGPMIFGQKIANQCRLVIGIDFSPTALKIAKRMLEAKGIKNYLLIQGDILNMPIKTNTVDLIYGGGVIEHFKNTQTCINELYRVLKEDGVSFNTVPYLNLGSLTYRQIWGNIPNFPVLKQLAEFIHIKLLKKRHMIFGYELSFLGSTLKKMHRKVGFKEIYVDKFKVKLSFDFIPTEFLKKICIKIANNSRLFWPMIKVIAKK
ncbi:methyltransferase domain-containing protein [Candidatus Parcubacteria bacterium]|nr:methyltransferase domain-containing protein [Candidatus Parcubacteria bacterium]